MDTPTVIATNVATPAGSSRIVITTATTEIANGITTAIEIGITTAIANGIGIGIGTVIATEIGTEIGIMAVAEVGATATTTLASITDFEMDGPTARAIADSAVRLSTAQDTNILIAATRAPTETRTLTRTTISKDIAKVTTSATTTPEETLATDAKHHLH